VNRDAATWRAGNDLAAAEADTPRAKVPRRPVFDRPLAERFGFTPVPHSERFMQRHGPDVYARAADTDDRP
jgi:hypothetical protein